MCCVPLVDCALPKQLLVWNAIPTWTGLEVREPGAESFIREPEILESLAKTPLNTEGADLHGGRDTAAGHTFCSPSSCFSLEWQKLKENQRDRAQGESSRAESVMISGRAETRTTNSLTTAVCFHFPDFDLPHTKQPHSPQTSQESREDAWKDECLSTRNVEEDADWSRSCKEEDASFPQTASQLSPKARADHVNIECLNKTTQEALLQTHSSVETMSGLQQNPEPKRSEHDLSGSELGIGSKGTDCPAPKLSVSPPCASNMSQCPSVETSPNTSDIEMNPSKSMVTMVTIQAASLAPMDSSTDEEVDNKSKATVVTCKDSEVITTAETVSAFSGKPAQRSVAAPEVPDKITTEVCTASCGVNLDTSRLSGQKRLRPGTVSSQTDATSSTSSMGNPLGEPEVASVQLSPHAKQFSTVCRSRSNQDFVANPTTTQSALDPGSVVLKTVSHSVRVEDLRATKSASLAAKETVVDAQVKPRPAKISTDNVTICTPTLSEQKRLRPGTVSSQTDATSAKVLANSASFAAKRPVLHEEQPTSKPNRTANASKDTTRSSFTSRAQSSAVMVCISRSASNQSGAGVSEKSTPELVTRRNSDRVWRQCRDQSSVSSQRKSHESLKQMCKAGHTRGAGTLRLDKNEPSVSARASIRTGTSPQLLVIKDTCYSARNTHSSIILDSEFETVTLKRKGADTTTKSENLQPTLKRCTPQTLSTSAGAQRFPNGVELKVGRKAPRTETTNKGKAAIANEVAEHDTSKIENSSIRTEMQASVPPRYALPETIITGKRGTRDVPSVKTQNEDTLKINKNSTRTEMCASVPQRQTSPETTPEQGGPSEVSSGRTQNDSPKQENNNTRTVKRVNIAEIQIIKEPSYQAITTLSPPPPPPPRSSQSLLRRPAVSGSVSDPFYFEGNSHDTIKGTVAEKSPTGRNTLGAQIYYYPSADQQYNSSSTAHAQAIHGVYQNTNMTWPSNVVPSSSLQYRQLTESHRDAAWCYPYGKTSGAYCEGAESCLTMRGFPVPPYQAPGYYPPFNYTTPYDPSHLARSGMSLPVAPYQSTPHWHAGGHYPSEPTQMHHCPSQRPKYPTGSYDSFSPGLWGE